MNTICNEDCLHCPYEDCILEDLTVEAYKEQKAIQGELRPKTKLQQYDRDYYERNRDQINERRRNPPNPEEIKAKKKAWRKANPQKVKLQKKMYRLEHHDEILEKARADRAADPDRYCAYWRKHMAKRKRARAQSHNDAKPNPAEALSRAAYYQQNRSRIRSQQIAYYQQHKEEIHARQAIYREQHREEINVKQRERRRREKEQEAAEMAELQKSCHYDNVVGNSIQMLGG